MSTYARFTELFADGEYTFDLDIDQAIEFEKKLEKSLYATCINMTRGIWFVEDVKEIVRLALIGGGMRPVDALRLVTTYVEKRPIAENTALCVRILEAAFFGQEEKEKPMPQKIAELEQQRDEAVAEMFGDAGNDKSA